MTSRRPPVTACHERTRPAERRAGIGLQMLVLLLIAVLVVAVLALLLNIRDRKLEGRTTVLRVVDVDETTVDPEVWGRNWPRQHDSYLRTVDVQRTRYGGSENIQKLDEDPRLRAIFDGYAFAIDYREERGHAYMLADQRETERVRQKPQPGACLHCHASVLTAYREQGLERGAPGDLHDPLLSEAGLAQLQSGFEAVCAMPYAEATVLVDHPVACIDCHDPTTMALRVTRPGFMRGIAVLAASERSVPHLPSVERWRGGSRSAPYDPNQLASRQEMRSFVCAQCHVEYHFAAPGNLLTYPWHKGHGAEDILAYYDEIDFADWTHAATGARVLKAQHPEFELWSEGVHARAGVACADCHMPYVREGALKVSSHHVRSPLLDPGRSCGTCHTADAAEMVARAERTQERTRSLMDTAEAALVDLIGAIQAAKASGADDERLAGPRALQRRAQFLLDFVNAENSLGFHAPQETARLLGESIDAARRGQIALLASGAVTSPRPAWASGRRRPRGRRREARSPRRGRGTTGKGTGSTAGGASVGRRGAGRGGAGGGRRADEGVIGAAKRRLCGSDLTPRRGSPSLAAQRRRWPRGSSVLRRS